MERVEDIALIGKVAVLAAGLDGLVVVDTTDPANLTELGRHATAGAARRVDTLGNLAYVVGTDEGPVEVFQVVPEPLTAGLLLLGLPLVLGRRRRARTQA